MNLSISGLHGKKIVDLIRREPLADRATGTMPIRNRREALNYFAIIFENRLPAPARS